MTLPGTAGGQYTADGLEHSVRGAPSTRAEDHDAQLAKREQKVSGFDYGAHWADIEGEGALAIVTWGSTAAPVREALARARAAGHDARLVAIRLLSPARPVQFAAALDGATRVLIALLRSMGASRAQIARAVLCEAASIGLLGGLLGVIGGGFGARVALSSVRSTVATVVSDALPGQEQTKVTDGDVAPAVAAGLPGTQIDMVLGIGGAPEGVLKAAALRCLGGEIVARLKKGRKPLELVTNFFNLLLVSVW